MADRYATHYDTYHRRRGRGDNQVSAFYCEHHIVRSTCIECTPSGAILSDARLYRYALWRSWDQSKPYVMFIGLNPSTANETDDDPTIRRCISFAKSWGFGGVVMANLFAWRCTNPKDLLLKTHDAVGIDNDTYLNDIGRRCALVVAAWGNGDIIKVIDPERPAHVAKLFSNLCTLHINKDGQPGHPLYLKGDKTPEFWDGVIRLNVTINRNKSPIFRQWPGDIQN